MKQEIAIRIAEALESGLYQQTSGCLHRVKSSPCSSDGQIVQPGHCCLGVACDLHATETGRSWENTDIPGAEFASYLGENIVLPLTVVEWAGFENPYGQTRDGSDAFEGIDEPLIRNHEGIPFNCLANANDAGVPFAIIAKALRRNWAKF